MHIERPVSKQPIPDHATCVFKGALFDVYQWQQELFDNTTTTFETLRRPDTVVIFPVLPDDRILLTEEEQPGKIAFIGAPGGRMDAGEDVLDAAKRELREETGYEASEYILWNAQQPITKIDWAVYTFVAKGLTRVGDPTPDAGEKITQKPVTFDELVRIVCNKTFAEKEVQQYFFEARHDSTAMTALKKTFGLVP